ncbi:MAG: type effector Hrp-dependent outer, partial [Paenibacillus sp.]|nr:type effector Hrp-dependent outer [Paenibacillus sp.]
MKLAIIADDLTGANDSGVQLSRHGLKTAVLFQLENADVLPYDAVVYDTDSRSIAPEEAYSKVKHAAIFFIQAGFHSIFKKLDSTMRGNIGAEIDAVYDALQPDFMMIAPGYPGNDRIIRHSKLYLRGIPLAETEIALDPKTPVTESYLPELLREQTRHPIGTITVDDLELGASHIHDKLIRYQESGVPYLVVDSAEDRHLEQIVEAARSMPYTFGWAGSAGIAAYLPDLHRIPYKARQLSIPAHNGPILTVIGSVNLQTRAQLTMLIETTGTAAVAFSSFKAVSSPIERSEEKNKVFHEALRAAAAGRDVVIYTTGERSDIEAARLAGEARGLSPTETSNAIVEAIGEICSELLDRNFFRGLALSGGDTAKQICALRGMKGFELMDELEPGVPVTRFLGEEEMYVITKAGGFGTANVFS